MCFVISDINTKCRFLIFAIKNHQASYEICIISLMGHFSL